ncbi:MAG: RHS repeat-associated core domain-containing protein, partial [Bryobacteraceae bacterium]
RLYDFRHRTYAPVLGRFLQVDPLGVTPVADASGNPYEFAGGGPTHGVDPSGLFPPMGARRMSQLLRQVDQECREYCELLRRLNPNWEHAKSPEWPWLGGAPGAGLAPDNPWDYWETNLPLPHVVRAPGGGAYLFVWDVRGYFRRWDGGVSLGPGDRKWFEQRFSATGYVSPPGPVDYTASELRRNRELAFQMHRVVVFFTGARRGWAYAPPPPARPGHVGRWFYGPVLWKAVGHGWCICRRPLNSLCEVIDYYQRKFISTQGPPSS